MNEFYCYKGLRNGGTFLLDETTQDKIKSSPNQLIGKVVTLTDNYTVGYGSANAVPLGFVEMVEKEATNSDRLVVSVVWNQSEELIDCAGSETAGNFAACDGKGGIVRSTTPSNARIWGVDTAGKVATVYIHG